MSRIASSALETTLFIRPSACVSALDHHRDPLAAADAQGYHAPFLAEVLHRVEQRHQQTSSGGANRMPEHHRPSADVHFGGIELQELVVGERDHGEGYVD